jgi:nanoRNase/pAp phosphatase (c-di-AMP/oligoRNAs hydrolase)
MVIQNIDGPKLVLILKKIADKMMWSLRSRNVQWKLIDCNSIAKHFGGGGHKPAAWFSIPVAGKFEDQVKKVVNQIVKMIKKLKY